MSLERTGRIPPEDPNKHQNNPRVAREEKQKIEKIREIDPDEETRRRKQFSAMMEEAPKTKPSLKNPSPLEPSFYQNSSPPPANRSDAPDLPHSDQFWKKQPLPDDPPEKPPLQNEHPSSSAEKKDSHKSSPQQTSSSEDTSSTEDSDTLLDPSSKKKPKKSSEEPPVSAGIFVSCEKKPPSKGHVKAAKGEKTTVVLPQDPKEPMPFSPPAKASLPKHKGESTPLQVQNLPPLPAHVEPMALAATRAAGAYLNPEYAALFFQMVGQMYIMTTPLGITRTELILNHPSFAQSRFFGSTIVLEKYSTAPDSFNIRFSGTTEAVNAFKENLPGLMNSFQNGQFSFRVGRIDTEYRTEKPLFHRKKKAGQEGMEQDFEGSQ